MNILILNFTYYNLYLEQSKKIEEQKLLEFMQIFASAENELRYTLSPRLLLESLSINAMFGDQAKKN